MYSASLSNLIWTFAGIERLIAQYFLKFSPGKVIIVYSDQHADPNYFIFHLIDASKLYFSTVLKSITIRREWIRVKFVIRSSIQRFTSSSFLVLKWSIITTRNRVREGNVFSHVCLFTGEFPFDHYPWYHWSATGHMGTPQPFKLVHLGTQPACHPYPPGDPPPELFKLSIYLLVSGWLAFHWKTFLWSLFLIWATYILFLFSLHLHLGLLRISKRGHFLSVFKFLFDKSSKENSRKFLR